MQTLTQLLQTIVTLVQAAKEAGTKADVLCLTRADEVVLVAERLKIHIQSRFREEAEKRQPVYLDFDIPWLRGERLPVFGGMVVVWDAERTLVRPFNAEEEAMLSPDD